ncbi:MAG: PaaI family thioesterase [Croceimicrobium sp.]|nr:hotdog fold thioesterase [Bacteroidota bacterium]
MKSAKEVVDIMFQGDAFSQWLGIKVEETKAGYCRLSMQVREEMTNGFKIAHGGISYALADSALAFASNGHGTQALSIETAISHLKPIKEGSKIEAIASEIRKSRSLGVYEVKVLDEAGELLAHFKGTVFRKDLEW